MEDSKFTKERILSQIAVDPKIELFQNSENGVNILLRDELRYRLSCWIYTKTIPEKEVVKFFNPPTFFEWLFKKPRMIRLKLNAKDVFTEPLTVDGKTLRLYDRPRDMDFDEEYWPDDE